MFCGCGHTFCGHPVKSPSESILGALQAMGSTIREYDLKCVSLLRPWAAGVVAGNIEVVPIKHRPDLSRGDVLLIHANHQKDAMLGASPQVRAMNESLGLKGLACYLNDTRNAVIGTVKVDHIDSSPFAGDPKNIRAIVKPHTVWVKPLTLNAPPVETLFWVDPELIDTDIDARTCAAALKHFQKEDERADAPNRIRKHLNNWSHD